MRLKDKIALVTGASGNIGCATAKRFAEERVVIPSCGQSQSRAARGE